MCDMDWNNFWSFSNFLVIQSRKILFVQSQCGCTATTYWVNIHSLPCPARSPVVSRIQVGTKRRTREVRTLKKGVDKEGGHSFVPSPLVQNRGPRRLPGSLGRIQASWVPGEGVIGQEILSVEGEKPVMRFPHVVDRAVLLNGPSWSVSHCTKGVKALGKQAMCYQLVYDWHGEVVLVLGTEEKDARLLLQGRACLRLPGHREWLSLQSSLGRMTHYMSPAGFREKTEDHAVCATVRNDESLTQQAPEFTWVLFSSLTCVNPTKLRPVCRIFTYDPDVWQWRIIKIKQAEKKMPYLDIRYLPTQLGAVL